MEEKEILSKFKQKRFWKELVWDYMIKNVLPLQWKFVSTIQIIICSFYFIWCNLLFSDVHQGTSVNHRMTPLSNLILFDKYLLLLLPVTLLQLLHVNHQQLHTSKYKILRRKKSAKPETRPVMKTLMRRVMRMRMMRMRMIGTLLMMKGGSRRSKDFL